MCYVDDQVSQMRKASPLAAMQKERKGKQHKLQCQYSTDKSIQGKIIKSKYMTKCEPPRPLLGSSKWHQFHK